MSSSTVCQNFLESFAYAHVNDGFLEGDGERMLSCFMSLQGSPLPEVKKLKDKGNGLFRQNYYDKAAAYYDEACKLLSLSMGGIEGEDPQLLSDLAVSLNSNLAACALKLGEYKAALDLCSMILNTFPHNVKARFRRAVAFMKLNKFRKAELDLVEALTVEPGNKDVLRELEVVKGHLLIKDNGKRVLEVGPAISEDRICKKPVRMDEESVSMEVMEDQNNMNSRDIERVNMEVTDAQSDCGLVLDSGLIKDEHISNKSTFEFSKKGGGNSQLRIPRQAYQKLLEGKKVSFYRKRDLSTISIRILHIETPKELDIPRVNHKKKERRRRCPRKRKSKMVVAMNEDVGDEKVVIPDICSSKTSMCDNFSSPGSHTLQGSSRVIDYESRMPSCVDNDNANSVYSQGQTNFNNLKSFVFSAHSKRYNSKRYKRYCSSLSPSSPKPCRNPLNCSIEDKRRTATPKKFFSKGKKSPRHSLSTFSASRSFSRKFLRPCGVSVSCCRYYPEAQPTKKRKERFAQLASSNRPSKKHSLSVNPILSVISYSNNVVIKPDSESRVSTV